MRTRGIVFALSILALLTLGGCTWYVTDGYYDDGGGDWFCEGDECWECEGDRCWPDEGACRTDNDCAPGCYCVPDGGWCEETSYCDVDEDCRAGYVCDERDTCVPEGDRPGPDPAPTPDPDCRTDADCDAGEECTDAGTCTPKTCNDNRDCPDGTICDLEGGTCVPGEPTDAGQCDGVVACDSLPPTCPDDHVPGIADGCWTGACIPVAQCEVEPRTQCEDLRSSPELIECTERVECVRVTVTICTPNDDAPPQTDCRLDPDLCDCREADQCRTRQPGEAPFSSPAQ